MKNLICCISGCFGDGKPTRRGWCGKHYQQFYKNHPKYNSSTGEKRSHPFYIIWFERKQSNVLCERWLDFDNFVWDIGSKPEGNYFLVRTNSEPYGPTNFKWQEHLKRKEGETKKEWYARKWKSRQLKNPGMESDRSLRRKYGLTREEYNKKLEVQNFKCEICGNEETSLDGRTGSSRKLAVDHCHNSKKIRGLICNRCNTTLGKIEDNINLLQNMINYINKYKET